MRVLHTSDWHVGKKLGRYDRSEEHRAAIAEIAQIADAEAVDLVLHSGDVFDRPLPPIDALGIALDGLVRLTDGGRRPVVAIAGNHDAPNLFEALAPYLRSVNVHLVGTIKRPDEGGVLLLDTRGGRAIVSCFPFLREGRAFAVWDPVDEHYQRYADRLRRISKAYSAHATELAGRDAVPFLVAHFLVGGATVHGHGAPRGERALHMGEAYTATPDAVPPGPQYVALGHIHAPQRVPGAQVPAEYAGSILQLDFGEAGEEKRVVIVDVVPGRPAAVRSVPLTAGRRLLRPDGTWEEVLRMDGVYESYLDLTVHTAGPDPGLAERAFAEFDHLVNVRAEYPRLEPTRNDRGELTLRQLYAEFYAEREAAAAPDDLLALFDEVLEEATDAAT